MPISNRFIRGLMHNLIKISCTQLDSLTKPAIPPYSMLYGGVAGWLVSPTEFYKTIHLIADYEMTSIDKSFTLRDENECRGCAQTSTGVSISVDTFLGN